MTGIGDLTDTVSNGHVNNGGREHCPLSSQFPPPLPVDQTHYPPRDQLTAQLQSSPECPRHGQRPDNTTT